MARTKIVQARKRAPAPEGKPGDRRQIEDKVRADPA